MTSRLLALILVCTLAGSALGTGGRPVEAKLRLPPPQLVGTVSLAGGDVAVDLTRAVQEHRRVSLSWRAADGWLVTSERVWRADRMYRERGTSANDTLAWSASTLEGLTCADGCHVVLFFGGDTEPWATASIAGPLELSADEVSFAAEWNSSSHHDAFAKTLPRGAVALGEPQRLGSASFQRIPDATLFLVGAAGRVVGPTRNDTLDATPSDETNATLGGALVSESEFHRFAVLHLGDVQLSIADAPDVVCDGCIVSFSGDLSSAEASGTLETDRTYTLDRSALRIVGDLAIAPSLGSRVVDVARDGHLDVAARGRATLITIDGASIVETASAPSAANGLVLAGLVAALVVAVRASLFPLYSRLTKAKLLDHPHRARLVELVEAEPGATCASLSRTLGSPRVVVQHHLDHLLAHGLLMAERSGRERNFFTPGALRDARTKRAWQALQHPIRRDILGALVAGAPPTHASLAKDLGISRRLVAYHASLLRAAGLIESNGAWRARLRASALGDELARELGKTPALKEDVVSVRS